MIERLLILLLLVLLSVRAYALGPSGGAPAVCPSNANGSVILPNTSCSLTDNSGVTWTFSGGTSLSANGAIRGNFAAFGLGNCAGACANKSAFLSIAVKEPFPGAAPYFLIWQKNGGPQVISP